MKTEIDDRVLLIDTFAVYMFYIEDKSVEIIWGLDNLELFDDVQKLGDCIVEHLIRGQ